MMTSISERRPAMWSSSIEGRAFGIFAAKSETWVAGSSKSSAIRGHVARRRTGAAGGQHQIAADLVGELDEGVGDGFLIVGDEPSMKLVRRGDDIGEPALDRRARTVFVDAAAGAI